MLFLLHLKNIQFFVSEKLLLSFPHLFQFKIFCLISLPTLWLAITFFFFFFFFSDMVWIFYLSPLMQIRMETFLLPLLIDTLGYTLPIKKKGNENKG